MNDGPREWFAPKRYGLGSGFPIAWQGWTVLAAYAAFVGLAASIFGPENKLALSIVIPVTIGLLVVMARTTRGGWRWRWGEKD